MRRGAIWHHFQKTKNAAMQGCAEATPTALQNLKNLYEVPAANALKIAAQCNSFRKKTGAGQRDLFRRVGANLNQAEHRVTKQIMG